MAPPPILSRWRIDVEDELAGFADATDDDADCDDSVDLVDNTLGLKLALLFFDDL